MNLEVNPQEYTTNRYIRHPDALSCSQGLTPVLVLYPSTGVTTGRAISVPDVCPSSIVLEREGKSVDFSMSAGEWLEVYGDEVGLHCIMVQVISFSGSFDIW